MDINLVLNEILNQYDNYEIDKAEYIIRTRDQLTKYNNMNETIIQLWNDGLTVGQITEQLGCSGQDVFTVLSPIIKAGTYGL